MKKNLIKVGDLGLTKWSMMEDRLSSTLVKFPYQKTTQIATAYGGSKKIITWGAHKNRLVNAGTILVCLEDICPTCETSYVKCLYENEEWFVEFYYVDWS